jgi:hypothetical protein
MDTLWNSAEVLGMFLGLLCAIVITPALIVLTDRQPHREATEILIVVFTKKTTTNGVVPVAYQAWYRQVMKTVRRFRAYRGRPIRRRILLIGRPSDVVTYKRVFTNSFAFDVAHISVIDAATIKQMKNAVEGLSNTGAEIEIVSIVSQFPVVHWLTEGLRPNYFFCSGLAGPGHLIFDLLSMCYPALDLVRGYTLKINGGLKSILGGVIRLLEGR